MKDQARFAQNSFSVAQLPPVQHTTLKRPLEERAPPRGREEDSELQPLYKKPKKQKHESDGSWTDYGKRFALSVLSIVGLSVLTAGARVVGDRYTNGGGSSTVAHRPSVATTADASKFHGHSIFH